MDYVYHIICTLELQVMASDGISNDTTIVRILVKDVNDNNPQFPTKQYNKTVPEASGLVYSLDKLVR
jgi:hypothetical protein